MRSGMPYSREEVAELLDRFISGDVGDSDFDDFVSTSSSDPLLEEIRQLLIELPSLYPALDESSYANEDGIQQIGTLSRKLKENK
jgi:hypothetical protein